MAKVTGTKGNIVNVQILGIARVMARMKVAKIKVENGADLGVVRAGAYVEEEVKESIIGNRSEHKSIDTGHFVNDVKFDKTGKAMGKVHAPTTPYAQNVELSACIIGGPRHHFKNTKLRTTKNIREIVKKEIDA